MAADQCNPDWVTDIVRQVGMLCAGQFKLVGPPDFKGVVAREEVTYSGPSGTTLAVTLLLPPEEPR